MQKNIKYFWKRDKESGKKGARGVWGFYLVASGKKIPTSFQGQHTHTNSHIAKFEVCTEMVLRIHTYDMFGCYWDSPYYLNTVTVISDFEFSSSVTERQLAVCTVFSQGWYVNTSLAIPSRSRIKDRHSLSLEKWSIIYWRFTLVHIDYKLL